MPGCWLKKGDNEIIVMDIVGPEVPALSGLDHPIIDNLRRELLPTDAVKGVALPTRKAKSAKPANESVGNDAAPGAK